MKNKPTSFGKNIKKHREIVKLTQYELALKSLVTFQTISNLETGRNCNPTIDTLARIAATLGVSVGQLLGDAAAGARSEVIRKKAEKD